MNNFYVLTAKITGISLSLRLMVGLEKQQKQNIIGLYINQL